MVTRAETLGYARTRAAARGALHPGAWLAWLVAGCVCVFLTSNPLYVSIGLLVACGAFASVWDAPKRRALTPFLLLGVTFALLSIPFNVLTGSSGPTVLFTLPELTSPKWFGGAPFGGDVTGEAAVTATSRALGIATLVMMATAFNAAIDHGRLLRLAPRSLAQVMLVMTIGVLVVPQAMRHARAVVEARRLRGRPTRGLQVAAVLLPVLAGALERSVQRAESLDARGFGGGTTRSSRLASLAGVAGLGVCCWGAFAHFYYGVNAWSSIAIAAGAAVVLLALWRGGGAKQQRLVREPWHTRDVVVVCAAAASAALLLAMRIADAGDVAYLAYPTVSAPAFHPIAAAAFLLLLAPALWGAGEEGVA